MKKSAFMAFAALAFSAGSCDENGSSGNSPYTKQCNQHLNEIIKCLKEINLSAEEDPPKKVIYCYPMGNQINSLADLLTEEQQNKKKEQLKSSKDTRLFQHCFLVMAPEPIKIIEASRRAASSTSQVYTEMKAETAPSIISVCGASSAEKARKTFCAQP